MAKTRLDIANDLAPMLGCAVAAELEPGDQSLLIQLVNQAYGRVFTPIDGHRPKWSERQFSLQFPEPLELEVTGESGGKTVTVDTGIPAGTEGARLRVGDRFYVISSTREDPGEVSILQPWESGDGTFSAKLYFPCRAMPYDFLQMIGTPMVPSLGILYAINGQDAETDIRSFLSADFWPIHQRYRQLNYPRRTFEKARSFDIGDPYFFYVDSSDFSSDTAHIGQSRLCIYPFPDHRHTVEFRYNFHATLPEDGSVLRLPADIVDTVFMPLCREMVAVHFPDYAGQNTQLLIREGEKAVQQLRGLSRPQRKINGRIRPKSGWA